jgi:exonuclease SbcC
MIPQRLSVRNFLCYREDAPTLDFSGIHVACLCGNNGHGKSALLDAITWCLWGEARSKSQDDLISYGAGECRVELDFSSRDTCYRVIRSRSRGGTRRRQGVTDLQFQVIGGDSPRAVTGNSVRETQAKIIQTVGMDYDTFINSAFLLQGRADEFTNKTPADRKAVLAKIMGLETYDRLQGSARDRLNEATAAAAEAAGALQRMKSDAEEAGDPSGLLAELQTHLAAHNLRLLDQRHATEKLHATVEELQRQRDSLPPLQDQIQEAVQDLSELQVSLDAAGGRVSQYQSLIDKADSIRDGVKALERAREQFDSMETARVESEQLTARKAITVRAIDVAKSRLETVAEQLERKVRSELLPKAEAESELTLEMDRIRADLIGLKAEETEITAERQRLSAVSTAIGEAHSAAERYKTEGLELRSKLELLDRSNGHDPLCPLCQTPLGDDGCLRLAKSYRVEIEDKRDLFRQNQARLESLQTKQTNMESGLARREDTLAKAARASQAGLSSLELRIQESRQAQQDLATAQTDLVRVSNSLVSGGYARQEYEDLRDVDQKINTLAYDEQARQQSYGEIQELQHFLDLNRQLGYAEDNLPLETAALQRAQDMLERRQSELGRLRLQHAANLEAVGQLPSLQTQLESSDSALKLLEGQVRQATAKQGFLQGEVERLEGIRRDIAASSVRLSALEEDQAVYRELVGAFGRQGIQAMLIETVLPRLEEEANLLLGRMTDNRMQVQLETQRDRRSGRGDPIETLQINVTDELGPRAYEMYSGGEAFRVNLALRIGLSKVLSQRMGAPLPTLFIDEGFGSQDAAGRERILDVIGAIEGDFDKIIVITHLEDLKDAFPVRIEVQKGEFGSSFWLS